MKDLIERLLKFIPDYLMEFIQAFSGPKKFIAKTNFTDDKSYEQALLFLGISLVLGLFLMNFIRVGDEDYWEYLGRSAIITIILIGLGTGIIFFSWKCVGGSANFKKYFITHCYFNSVILMIITLFMLIYSGILKTLTPELYKFMSTNQPLPFSDGISEAYMFFFQKQKEAGADIDFMGMVLLISSGCLLIGHIIACIWFYIAWGAFRELNQSTKFRSFLAALFAGILSIPFYLFAFFIYNALGLY
jgi:hypothetical protein